MRTSKLLNTHQNSRDESFEASQCFRSFAMRTSKILNKLDVKTFEASKCIRSITTKMQMYVSITSKKNENYSNVADTLTFLYFLIYSGTGIEYM